jgi:hypothetical protein
MQHYPRESSAAQVPGKIVMRFHYSRKAVKLEWKTLPRCDDLASRPERQPTPRPATMAHEKLTARRARASNKREYSCSTMRAAKRPICYRKLLLATKHFPGFYVFTDEGEDKLNVAEKP